MVLVEEQSVAGSSASSCFGSSKCFERLCPDIGQRAGGDSLSLVSPLILRQASRSDQSLRAGIDFGHPADDSKSVES